jgi:hypothetical protein
MNIAPGFLTELVTRKVKEAGSTGRAKWELQQDLAFHSARVGLIIAPAGFVTDFASVPRVPLAYWLTGDTAHKSAVIHDYICRVWVPRLRITWREAALVFEECMKHEGVPAWRRKLMTWAVMGADPDKQTEHSA